MSETTTEPTTDTEAQPAPAQETDWKAEARKWEARAKENNQAAKRLAELEESQKTEIQRATERAEAAERALAAKEAEALRLTVAARHGIGADNLDLLYGDDEAELEARAKKIATLIAPREEPQEETPKGVLGPYVPGEGKTPKRSLGTTADMFAASIESAFS